MFVAEPYIYLHSNKQRYFAKSFSAGTTVGQREIKKLRAMET